MKGKVRVVIADDHVLVREGIRKLLESMTTLSCLPWLGMGKGHNIARKTQLMLF